MASDAQRITPALNKDSNPEASHWNGRKIYRLGIARSPVVCSAAKAPDSPENYMETAAPARTDRPLQLEYGQLLRIISREDLPA